MTVKRSAKPGKVSKQEAPQEPVWTYRGYEIPFSDLSAAMGQMFNMAGQRASTLRQRLDTTTNWAIVSTGATISVAFGQPDVHHGIIILNVLLVLWFLSIEAQRYRNYELWNHYVRQMETDFYMAMLVPPFHSSSEQLERLTENLLIPRYPISIREAFGRRLRRRYHLMFSVLYAAWIFKIWLFPAPASTLSEFILRASVAALPGTLIIATGLIFYLILVIFAVIYNPVMQAAAQALPSLKDESAHLQASVQRKRGGLRAWLNTQFRSSVCRVLLVTNRPESISRRILTDLGRKVNATSGSSMYIGSDRTVLTCTLPITQVQDLKNTVVEEDPQAFVILWPHHVILGRVFYPLEED